MTTGWMEKSASSSATPVKNIIQRLKQKRQPVKRLRKPIPSGRRILSGTQVPRRRKTAPEATRLALTKRRLCWLRSSQTAYALNRQRRIPFSIMQRILCWRGRLRIRRAVLAGLSTRRRPHWRSRRSGQDWTFRTAGRFGSCLRTAVMMPLQCGRMTGWEMPAERMVLSMKRENTSRWWWTRQCLYGSWMSQQTKCHTAETMRTGQTRMCCSVWQQMQRVVPMQGLDSLSTGM